MDAFYSANLHSHQTTPLSIPLKPNNRRNESEREKCDMSNFNQMSKIKDNAKVAFCTLSVQISAVEFHFLSTRHIHSIRVQLLSPFLVMCSCSSASWVHKTTCTDFVFGSLNNTISKIKNQRIRIQHSIYTHNMLTRKFQLESSDLAPRESFSPLPKWWWRRKILPNFISDSSTRTS